MPVRMCQTYKTYQPVKRENKKYKCNLYAPQLPWEWRVAA